MATLTRSTAWRGRRVAWDVLGDAGPDVVMCHGTPWSSALWRPFAEALSAHHRVHLWDMPGFGESSKDAEHDVSLATQGELFADLLEAWGLDAPHVVVHDVGGAVALRAHLLHGAALASLALVDVVALTPWGSPFFRLVRENADVLARLPDAVHEGAVRAYVRTAAHRPLTSEAEDVLVRPWLGDDGRPAFYRQVSHADETHTEEVAHLYPTVQVPTLVVWGREDTWIPVDRAHRLHEVLPGSELRIVDDAGHLVHLDQPVALAAVLTRWLADQSRH